jgi:hypothetical protein
MKNFVCIALGFLLMSVCQETPSLAASSTAEAKDTLLLDEHPELLTPSGSLQQRAATPSADAAGYKVRIVYLVPSNRMPQPDAEKILQEYVGTIQGWFGDQMERLGYAPKTFAVETAADGVTPVVHVAYATEPDTFFHVTDYLQRWNLILSAVSNAGFSPWRFGEVLFIVAETHAMQPDGSFVGGFVGGAGTSFSGVSVVTGEFLARMKLSSLIDDRPYAGLVIPELGPYALVSGISFPSFEGTSVSSVSSSAQGAALHELGHAFGLSHDFRNDENFHGVLMGNGLRGFRGSLFPHRYPLDDMRLDNAAALTLNYSRFFNPDVSFTDQQAPSVMQLSSGTVMPVDGQCGPTFTTTDNTALGGAVLLRDGNIVAEKALFGNSLQTMVLTPYYQPGQQSQWEILIVDQQGNRSLSGSLFTCALGVNRAPVPDTKVLSSTATFGHAITLVATRASDPDGNSAAMRVEWDIDGDGVFDTPLSTNKVRDVTYTTAGVYQVIARLTDEVGNSSISTPIGVRVLPIAATTAINELVTFTPLRQTFQTVSGTTGCPAGFVGTFSFTAELTNKLTSSPLAGLQVQVVTLSDGNLLQNADDGPSAADATLTVAFAGQFGDRFLSPGEFVNVPFAICLKEHKPFQFLVDLLGEVP